MRPKVAEMKHRRIGRSIVAGVAANRVSGRPGVRFTRAGDELVTSRVGYREIGVSLVTRALDCASVWLLEQDLCGRLIVTTWDREGGPPPDGRAVGEEVFVMLAAQPVLRPTIDADGAIMLTVKAAEGGLAGWRLIGAVTYSVPDLEAVARLVSVLADPRMLEHTGRPPPATPPVLTARESEILTLVGGGLTARTIARRCGISERTVHKHLEHAYRKLDCHDRLSAVLLARDTGLLTGGALAPAT